MEMRPQLRLAAPIVLVIFAIALLVIVTGSTGGGSAQSQTKASVEKQRDLGTGQFATGSAQPQQQPASIPGGTYVVKSGDTLGAIAQRTGVSIATLQQLNPNVDPQTLVSGQKLKLR